MSSLYPFSCGPRLISMSFLATGHSKQCSCDGHIRRFLLFYLNVYIRQLAFYAVECLLHQIVGARPKGCMIGCCSIRTIKTIHIFICLIWLEFSPLSKKNYGVYHIPFSGVHLWHAVNDYRVRDQNFSHYIFFVQNVIFLTQLNIIKSHLQNASKDHLKPFIAKNNGLFYTRPLLQQKYTIFVFILCYISLLSTLFVDNILSSSIWLPLRCV